LQSKLDEQSQYGLTSKAAQISAQTMSSFPHEIDRGQAERISSPLSISSLEGSAIDSPSNSTSVDKVFERIPSPKIPSPREHEQPHHARAGSASRSSNLRRGSKTPEHEIRSKSPSPTSNTMNNSFADSTASNRSPFSSPESSVISASMSLDDIDVPKNPEVKKKRKSMLQKAAKFLTGGKKKEKESQNPTGV
jgi:hypothetical protein